MSEDKFTVEPYYDDFIVRNTSIKDANIIDVIFRGGSVVANHICTALNFYEKRDELKEEAYAQGYEEGQYQARQRGGCA